LRLQFPFLISIPFLSFRPAANFQRKPELVEAERAPGSGGGAFAFPLVFPADPPRISSGRMCAKYAIEDSIHMAKLPLKIKRVRERFRIEYFAMRASVAYGHGTGV